MAAKTWFAVAALIAWFGVAAGAFGAHGLKARLGPDLLDIFETAVRYQMYHAFGLGLMALAGLARPDLDIRGPAWALLVGTIIFCGSLYVLVLTEARWLGAITPIGGLGFLIGWAWLAWSALRLN